MLEALVWLYLLVCVNKAGTEYNTGAVNPLRQQLINEALAAVLPDQ